MDGLADRFGAGAAFPAAFLGAAGVRFLAPDFKVWGSDTVRLGDVVLE